MANTCSYWVIGFNTNEMGMQGNANVSLKSCPSTLGPSSNRFGDWRTVFQLWDINIEFDINYSKFTY